VSPVTSEGDFRLQSRAWLEAAVHDLPPAPRADDLGARREYDARWQRRLHEAGYAGLAWPVEHGGRGASAMVELVFYEEAERAGAPDVGVHFAGQNFIGPTIIVEGTTEQRERYLPPILRGDEVWCQGFSEPDAGSDLAGLRTRAVRDGDEYVINGQKVWTSYCAVADYCELLVRTDPNAPRHRGITCVIVPMRTAGIEVRPLRTMVGYSEFGEVFFDGVRIPVESRLGAENDGWRVAMVTLGFERGTAFARSLLQLAHWVDELKRIAQQLPAGSGTVWDDPSVQREIGAVAGGVDALQALLRANVARADREGHLGPEVSIFKLAYSEAGRRLADLTMQVLGRGALAPASVGIATAPPLVREALQSLSWTIASGTSEIQRNIIAETVLGLPKAPRPS
jgi:alkylation response protein AidB-like acyl-CoA dehydrogenase